MAGGQLGTPGDSGGTADERQGTVVQHQEMAVGH